MRVDFLHEPVLEFGVDRHVDIRFGILQYGPLDYAHPLAPKEIKIGIVGTPQTVTGIRTWLERCRSDIPAKPSNQPNLFPPFPGCTPEVGFRMTLVLDERLQRTIPPRAFDALTKLTDTDEVIREAVDLFLNELQYLSENTTADVLICALPMALVERMDQDGVQVPDPHTESSDDESTSSIHLNFRNFLKARAMRVRQPIQIVLPTTYDPTQRRLQKGPGDRPRRLQDEATRAWNFHTALYYKAGGTPWRLVRDAAEYTTCYVGISFYHSLDRSRILTSIAQVFNERGEGVVVRGGAATRSQDDRQIHLRGTDAYDLLKDALKRYRDEHRTLPARVVLHKTSAFNDDEEDGFLKAALDQGIELYDFLSVSRSSIRLYRTGSYPPLRGTFLSLDGRTHALYTRGSVNFFATYPGMYVPRPLLFRCAYTEQDPHFLAQELLALTKMNYNNTQFDGGFPITIRAAREIGGILKYVGEHDPIATRYRSYM